jgi:hypothetical protein
MNKKLIKINRKSIVKNPNAGSTQTYLPSIPQMRISMCLYNGVEVQELIKKYGFSGMNTPGKIRLDFMVSCLEKKVYDFFIKNMDDPNKVLKKILKTKNACLVSCRNSDLFDGVIIDEDRRLELIRHTPEEKYFYTYENKKIKCNNCGSKVSSKKIGWGGFCPKCEFEGCFDIEYENINEVAKELNI